MSLKTQRTGQIGINVVERIVLNEWRGRWQPLDSVNDDGVDGLIFIENRDIPTGQVIFVQVKCHASKKDRKSRFCIPINREKLTKNIERWRRVVGAAILVHVDPNTLKAHWVNLRDPNALGKTQVFVPDCNKFDKKASKAISSLCGTIHRDFLVKRIDTENSDFRYLTEPVALQSASRKFYVAMKQKKICFNQGEGKPIRFTKEGWHHITRRTRSRLTQLQSFQLLGALPKILASFDEADLKDFGWNQKEEEKRVYLQAVVTFPFRQTAIIKVVLLQRKDEKGDENYSFHTIYEPRRKRDVIGVK